MRNLTLALFSILACLLLSCSKDNSCQDPLTKVYGQQDSIAINMSYALEGISTKAINEALVENVNLYIVNELGDLVSHGYYTTTSNKVDAVIYKNMRYTVYAVANAGRSLPAKSATEVENLTYTISSASELAASNGAVLMSGNSGLQLLSDNQNLPISLQRCVSKIIVRTDFSELNSDVNLTINSISLKNTPNTVSIFKDNKISTAVGAMDGQSITSPSSAQLASGVVLYQYENKQGNLLPDNSDQKAKTFANGSIYASTCSYVEIDATYSSPRKRGNITYCFYIGTDMVSNFDAIRNTQHNITVTFKGEGAVDETSWRVDNSEIVDLVTSVTLSPTYIKFTTLGETAQLTASVLPLTAANKTLNWRSSNSAVATVDANGKVTAVAAGTTRIKVSGHGDLYCTVTVVAGQIEFQQQSITLYDGETATLQFSKLIPSGASFTVTSSNGNTVQVVSYNESGVVVKGLATGSATITATLGSVSTTCNVSVEKLRIIPAETNISLYKGFYDDIGYTIYPARAAGLRVELSSPAEGENLKLNHDSVANRVLPNCADGETDITISIAGRSDVSATIHATFKPSISLLESVTVLTNKGNSPTIVDLQLDTHPRALSNITWTFKDNDSNIDNYTPEDMSISPDGILTVDLGAKENGTYTLTADAGQNDVPNDVPNDVHSTCTLELYETLYLLGVSKTQSRTSLGSPNIGIYKYRYSNEVVAKYYAHPLSYYWPQGEVTGLDFSFIYDGQTYDNSHTGVYEELEQEFVQSNQYTYINGDIFTFNGHNAPLYYLSYFYLEYVPKDSDETRPILNDTDRNIQYWVVSSNFASGWIKEEVSWKYIFQYVYPSVE